MRRGIAGLLVLLAACSDEPADPPKAATVAKSACSVAVLTNDRFGFGIGSSPWPEDFIVTGTDWATRGAPRLPPPSTGKRWIRSPAATWSSAASTSRVSSCSDCSM